MYRYSYNNNLNNDENNISEVNMLKNSISDLKYKLDSKDHVSSMFI